MTLELDQFTRPTALGRVWRRAPALIDKPSRLGMLTLLFLTTHHYYKLGSATNLDSNLLLASWLALRESSVRVSIGYYTIDGSKTTLGSCAFFSNSLHRRRQTRIRAHARSMRCHAAVGSFLVISAVCHSAPRPKQVVCHIGPYTGGTLFDWYSAFRLDAVNYPGRHELRPSPAECLLATCDSHTTQ